LNDNAQRSAITAPTDGETERALREAVRQQRILSEVSRVLLDYAGSDEVEPLRRIVQLVVEAQGDWCAFLLIGSDASLRTVAQLHPDPRRRALADEVVRRLPPRRWDAGPPETNALLQRRPIYYERFGDETLRAGGLADVEYQLIRQLELKSLILAPMLAGAEPLGLLVLASAGPEGQVYGAKDVDFVFSLAGRAALAIRHARLVRALDHERREAMLRAAELLAVLEASPNGILIFGADDELRYASAGMDRAFGYPFSKQVGRHYRELLTDPAVPKSATPGEMERKIGAFFADRGRSGRDVISYGGRHYIRTSTPVTHGGAYLGRLFMHADVTQEHELDRQRAEFLTVAAHELRTPLTPLSMYLQTIERRLGRGQALEPELAGKARRQVARIEKLVQDLLDLSRVESDRIALRHEPVALEMLAAEVVSDFRATVHEHQIVLHVQTAPVAVSGDRERLEQVLVNLIANAIKYSPQGGDVDVTVGTEGEEAVVAVTDRGIGIPREEQPRLFERFFRARNAAATNYGGLGIGLFVSREIVHRHDGRFEVQSEVGRGTTFRFRLPLDREAMRSKAGARVLLVDDDPDILEATTAFLADEGLVVEQARDGQAALEMVRRSPPDLMLLDLMMPVLDGWAFMEQLRAEQLAPGVPVVVFSADRDVREKAASLGADATLHKPFSLDELHELIGRLLRKG
jgi:signal transduction histidine kinase